MSNWQAYVDNNLVGSGSLDKAVICDAAGTTAWASSAGFSIDPDEMQFIAQSFSDTSDPKNIISNGFKVGKEKYMTIESTDDHLKGKKGKEGIVAKKTHQTILIGHHNAETLTTNAFNVVEVLGEYLINLKY